MSFYKEPLLSKINSSFIENILDHVDINSQCNYIITFFSKSKSDTTCARI